MMARGMIAAALCASLMTLGGCAGDGLLGGGPTTAALPEKPKVNPACVSLASQIDGLRKEGVADRVAAASQGKGATVTMKRESLAKVAELNKANADFQAKCGTVAPSNITAQPAAPAQPAVTPAAAAKAVKAVSSTPAATKSAAVAVPKATAVAPAAAAVAKDAVEAVKPKSE